MARGRQRAGSGGPALWEYDEEFLRHDHEWSQVLNAYGAKGWELVAMIHDESSSDPLQVRCVFKRPLVAEASAEQDGE